MFQPQQPNPQTIAKVNSIVTHLAPHLNELITTIKSLNMHEFEIMVGNGSDKLSWNNGVIVKSPTQDQLAIEITHILDQAYPMNVTSFLGMIWSQNSIIANKIAEIVAEYRKRDRAQVESQIVALLAAFKQSL